MLVPVRGAGTHEDGIRVAYDKDQVKDSPDIDSDEIDGERECALYEYYGVDRPARAFTRPTESSSVARPNR